jgi:hypothetical protein
MYFIKSNNKPVKHSSWAFSLVNTSINQQNWNDPKIINEQSKWKIINEQSKWKIINEQSKWKIINEQSKWKIINEQSKW